MERPAQHTCSLLRSFLTLGVCAVATLTTACSTPSYIYVERGNIALEDGDYEHAESQFTLALDNRGGSTDARMGLARTQLKLGQPAHAREQMEMVYSVHPQDPKVLDLLAETMIASGDVAGMQSLLVSNAQLSNHPQDWLRLGRHLMTAGDLDEAKQAMFMAARLDHGQSAVYQVALAEFFASIGDHASSKERYRMALYAEPMNETVKDALRQMGEIPGPTLAIPPAEIAIADDDTR